MRLPECESRVVWRKIDGFVGSYMRAIGGLVASFFSLDGILEKHSLK